MTEVTRGGSCKFRPPQEGVPLHSSRRSDMMKRSFARTIRSEFQSKCDEVEEMMHKCFESHHRAVEEMERKWKTKTSEESIEVASANDGTPREWSTLYDRNRKHRLSDKSIRR